MKQILVVLCLLVSLRVSAQVVDTTKKSLPDTIKKDLFTAPDTVQKLHSKLIAFLPPVALIAYGALSFPVHPIRRFDYYVHGEVNRTGPDFHSTAESYFQFAPVAAVYALNLIGVEGKNRFIDRTALLGLSAGILGVSVYGTKHSTHRLRPNNGDYFSFPSGHTANAFMGAEFLAQEFSGKSVWYGIAGYTIAATTGVFRMYNQDHWFSDVVAGAGYGIISTKVAYFVYPYLRNLLTHTGKSGKSVMLMPSYQEGTPGLYFTMQL